MDKHIVLSNEILKVTLSTIGAELLSVKKGSEELIWIADPKVWKSHAPLLFPIIGMLKDNKYIYDDKEYELKFHGYAHFTEFEVESQSAKKIVLLHRFNEETLKVFPFKYELRVIYTLNNSILKVEYNIKNLENKEMYFSIGSHEGLYCPDGIEEYSVVFESPENLDYVVCCPGGLLANCTKNIGMNVTELPLEYKYFKDGSLTFLNMKSKKITLINRNTKNTIELKIDDKHTAFTLWSVPNAKFICLEPWCGMPDFVDSDYNIKNKRGIICLEGYAETTRTHEIKF